MLLKAEFVEQTKQLLGPESEVLFNCIDEGKAPISIRYNPDKPTKRHLNLLQPVPWNEQGVYLTDRPLFTADPLFHAGAYYVQEASSMFLAEAVKQHVDLTKAVVALDLCAAPGGKSTLLSSLLKDSDVLISNEINKSRADILTENIQKWGKPNVVVTRNSPSDFNELPELFDLIVVDAPCSGEGMFRKTPHAIEEWSPENVELCTSRQREILESIWPCLKPGGVLIYSTCTFNLKENEEQIAWMIEELGAENVPLDICTFPGIQPGFGEEISAARFFPHKSVGEGLFMSVVQKADDQPQRIRIPKNKISELDKKSVPMVSGFLKANRWTYFEHRSQVFAALPAMSEVIARISTSLYPLHFGVVLGELKGKDLIPAPGLAFSTQLNSEALQKAALTKDQALALLSKETPSIEAPSGWVLCTYDNLGLVWIKSLNNRINNYYPKEWRIRSDYRNFD